MKRILVFALLLTMCCCHTARKVQITEKIVYKDSIVNHTDMQRDSIYFHDSVIVKLQGDTILKESFRIGYKDRFIYKTDTVFVHNNSDYTQSQETTKTKLPLWLWMIIVIVVCSITYRVLKYFRIIT